MAMLITGNLNATCLHSYKIANSCRSLRDDFPVFPKRLAYVFIVGNERKRPLYLATILGSIATRDHSKTCFARKVRRARPGLNLARIATRIVFKKPGQSPLKPALIFHLAFPNCQDPPTVSA